MGVNRPRVRGRRGKEKVLPTYKLLTCNDPLNERILEQMVVGVSTRRYNRSLEINIKGRATSQKCSKSPICSLSSTTIGGVAEPTVRGSGIAGTFS